MQKSHWTIAELSDEYGVSFRALRFYESSGLLKPVRRGTSRLFTPDDRIRLELILKGKRYGFTLSEIRLLILSGRNNTVVLNEDNNELISELGLQKLKEQIQFLERRRDEINWAIDELIEARQNREKLRVAN